MNERISRAEARVLGFQRYLTGFPCKRGHVSDRLVSNATCTECSKAAQIDHYRRNRERVGATQAKYVSENRDKVNAGALAWYRRSSEAKEINRSNCRSRRAARASAIPAWFGEFDELVIQEAGNLVQAKSERFGFAWHVDHMIPLKAKNACGLHCAYNIQVIPAALNLHKQNRMIFTEPLEWLGWWAGRESNPRSAD